MSRDLPPDLETEIDAPVSRPFFAVYIALPDEVRAWTGVGEITFDDADGNEQTWTGVGTLGQIDPIGEASDGSATGIKVSLFQAPAEFRDDIADQAVRGAAIEIYFGALDASFTNVEAAQLVWKGRVDEYKITDAGDSITVEISGESRGIDQRRPPIKRFSNEAQQRRHPGDRFFEYLPQMAEIPILWAKKEQTATTTSSGGGMGAGGGAFFGGRNVASF